MSEPTHISTGQRIDALTFRVGELQREVSALRQDVRRIMWMLEQLGTQCEDIEAKGSDVGVEPEKGG